MHLPHSTPRFQLRLCIVLPRAMGAFPAPIQFTSRPARKDFCCRRRHRKKAAAHNAIATREVQALTATIAPVDMPKLPELEEAGEDEDDVGDAMLVRPPELTGEADTVSAADVAIADAEVTSVAA
ncbi:hypothetical protein CSAL01_05181 [Colletotrichum salicis]|uniref:Uncharacterized protein n=1 Tax=Colletotrichum salicis TaxID=1209931 RepID=A0A135USP7_9PEZI|nr:hypothetical protein CSAL01_05181 [Colletotrichum salicis]